jgi:hypothetical protein
LAFYSGSSLKQQSAGRHVTLLGHIILIPSQPVFALLDNGNNKKAIQEADKVLKKQKDLQCAKVYSVDLSIKSSVAELLYFYGCEKIKF